MIYVWLYFVFMTLSWNAINRQKIREYNLNIQRNKLFKHALHELTFFLAHLNVCTNWLTFFNEVYVLSKVCLPIKLFKRFFFLIVWQIMNLLWVFGLIGWFTGLERLNIHEIVFQLLSWCGHLEHFFRNVGSERKI
jgi:hypothetical protein